MSSESGNESRTGSSNREVPSGRRDRDPAGRARNARPRDLAGRPLPRGATGAGEVGDGPAEDVVLPPGLALEEAQRLLDDGRPFAAHEVLEGAWKAAPGQQRALWQGLAQVAVGLTHLQRGNRTGAVALLRRGAGRIAGAGQPAPHRVDAAGVVRYAEELADRLDRDGPSPELPPPPRLRS